MDQFIRAEEGLHLLNHTDCSSSDNSFEIWKRKRKITTIIFYCSGIILGLEYSAVVLSLWFYMNDTIKVKHAPIYYSVTMTSMALSAILSSVVLGRFIDKSRNTRLLMLTLNILNAVGNVTYTLNFSVWFPIIGRFICGISDSLNAAISGNTYRYAGICRAPHSFNCSSLPNGVIVT